MDLHPPPPEFFWLRHWFIPFEYSRWNFHDDFICLIPSLKILKTELQNSNTWIWIWQLSFSYSFWRLLGLELFHRDTWRVNCQQVQDEVQLQFLSGSHGKPVILGQSVILLKSRDPSGLPWSYCFEIPIDPSNFHDCRIFGSKVE